MRALATVLAVTVMAGCGSLDYGAVLLHLEQRSADLSLPATYGSSATGVGRPSDGQLLFTATSSQGVLRVLVATRIHDGDTIAPPSDEERIHFQLGTAEWGNQGGTVYIISAEPAVIGLAMRHATLSCRRARSRPLLFRRGRSLGDLEIGRERQTELLDA